MDFFYFGNPHPSHDHLHNMPPSSPEIALSDYLLLDDFLDHHHGHSPSSQSTESSEKTTFTDATHGFTTGATSKNNNNNMQVPSLSLSLSYILLYIESCMCVYSAMNIIYIFLDHLKERRMVDM